MPGRIKAVARQVISVVCGSDTGPQIASLRQKSIAVDQPNDNLVAAASNSRQRLQHDLFQRVYGVRVCEGHLNLPSVAHDTLD
jgi:hypothetical protein